MTCCAIVLLVCVDFMASSCLCVIKFHHLHIFQSGGYKLSALEIERELLAHPQVQA
jgi:hypothetical protein